MIPTVGNLLWLIHDWLFTIQFVSAALLVPILTESFQRGLTNKDYPKSNRPKNMTLADTEEGSIMGSVADRRTQSQASNMSLYELVEMEKSSKKKVRCLMLVQYSLILAWFVTSLVIGTVFVRMSCWMVMVI